MIGMAEGNFLFQATVLHLQPVELCLGLQELWLGYVHRSRDTGMGQLGPLRTPPRTVHDRHPGPTHRYLPP